MLPSDVISRLASVARSLQRVFLVALCLIPVLLVTIASLPALAVLPFTAQGAQRSSKVLLHIASWTQRTLTASR